MKIDAKTTVGKAKGKLWLFGKKPKVKKIEMYPMIACTFKVVIQ